MYFANIPTRSTCTIWPNYFGKRVGRPERRSRYPASRAFLSGKSFSDVQCRSRLWYFVFVLLAYLCPRVSLWDVNKPAVRNSRSRDANDIVHAKGIARKKPSTCRVYHRYSHKHKLKHKHKNNRVGTGMK